jgi:dTDP-4-dehydrorhamnose reductase
VTRILITGASGLLGINLALEAAKQYEVVGIVHHHPLRDPGFKVIAADLLIPKEASQVIDEVRPDWVVNCAALANMDTCEEQPEFAQRLNAELPGRLATETATRKLRFLQVSTDAVFDGEKGVYDEEDAPLPLGVYGRTKRIAELAVKAAHPHVLIVRPNFFGWSVNGNRSLAEVFYNNLSNKKNMQGFTDRIFCPLLVTDLANILVTLLERNLRGLFHAVSSDCMSKYEFGLAIARRFNLDSTLIQPSETQKDSTKARRALNLSLNSKRLANALGHRLPTIAEGIEKFYEQFAAGYPSKLQSMSAVHEIAKG